MDSLALIECQRITALIENAIEKLGILASLTSGLFVSVFFTFEPILKFISFPTDGHNDELSTMVGEEITRIIQDQANLSQFF